MVVCCNNNGGVSGEVDEIDSRIVIYESRFLRSDGR